MIEERLAAWRGAVIMLDVGTPAAIVRPAAFVYEIPGGLAWLEPSYADPWGAASPAWHERLGKVAIDGLGVRLVTADGRTVSAVEYDRNDNGDMVGDSLEWFAGWLRSQGKTWAQERAARAQSGAAEA